MNEHEIYMAEALKLAREAGLEDEIPVGAVIIHNGDIISAGRNRRETSQNALAHAEIEAINKACLLLGQWRLNECSLYVTLEPCHMCMGAIINARVREVFFGAYDLKAGCCGSVINFNDLSFNHKPSITGGILNKECSEILSGFFRELRLKKLRAD